jgi:hypothetical protein
VQNSGRDKLRVYLIVHHTVVAWQVWHLKDASEYPIVFGGLDD